MEGERQMLVQPWLPPQEGWDVSGGNSQNEHRAPCMQLVLPALAVGEPPAEMQAPQQKCKPLRRDGNPPAEMSRALGTMCPTTARPALPSPRAVMEQGAPGQDVSFQPEEQENRQNQQLKPANPVLLAVSSTGPYISDWDALNATPGMGLDGAEAGRGAGQPLRPRALQRFMQK